MKKLYVQRYSDNQRINHWLVVLLFGLAGFSGLALFHPNLFFLTQLFGGPQWTRIVHPYFGIGTFLLFAVMFFMFWRSNTWGRADTEWVKAAPRMVATGSESHMPPVRKYNAGQKLVFWSMTLCLLTLIGTGVLFWQPWFGDAVPIPLQRAAVLVHAAAAFVMSVTAVVHIYAAIWVKGTLRAMTQGTVTAGWARHHHPLWFREKLQQAERAHSPALAAAGAQPPYESELRPHPLP